MSRYGDWYGEPHYDNAGELWSANARKALRGAKGRKALTELREALLALPNKRLIDNQLKDGNDLCAVGVYIWGKNVAKGLTSEEALEAVPDRGPEPLEITASLGKKFGMTYTLAWELAYRNDETYGNQTPEQRYNTFLNWIDKELAI